MGNLVVFNGGLMRGQSAHWKLRGATFLEAVRTAPVYRLYSIGDRHPAMLRVRAGGVGVGAELYHVPDAVWPRISNIEPPGLYRGPVELDDGRTLEGMLGEVRYVHKNGRDISEYGSWASYPHRAAGARMDKDPDDFALDVFVCGPHMRGLPRHGELGLAPYLGVYRTAPAYRMLALDAAHPALVETEPGAGVDGELYRVSLTALPALRAALPPALREGRVLLEDCSEVTGFLARPGLPAGDYRDITAHGDWRSYLRALEAGQ